MKPPYIAILSITSLFLTECTNGEIKKMNAFYIPFQAQTFAPVTADSIERNFKKRLVVSNGDPLLDALIRAHKNGAASQIDENQIRFKYERGKTRILVDSTGVISLNGVSRNCSKEQFSKIEKLIQKT